MMAALSIFITSAIILAVLLFIGSCLGQYLRARDTDWSLLPASSVPGPQPVSSRLTAPKPTPAGEARSLDQEEA